MGRSIFSEEVSQRAGLARNARHKIGGSKSKKCPMSTDRMTQRQWEKRNGEVNTYRLTKPMSWAEFKAYPEDLQKEYLSSLVNTYGANLTTLGAMFGITAATVKEFVDKRGYDFGFKAGHRMTAEQRESWQKFLGVNNTESNNMIVEPLSQREQEPIVYNTTEERDIPPMSMTQFSFTFQGKIDTSAIANSILQLLGENGCGKVEVVCTL